MQLSVLAGACWSRCRSFGPNSCSCETAPWQLSSASSVPARPPHACTSGSASRVCTACYAAAFRYPQLSQRPCDQATMSHTHVHCLLCCCLSLLSLLLINIITTHLPGHHQPHGVLPGVRGVPGFSSQLPQPRAHGEGPRAQAAARLAGGVHRAAGAHPAGCQRRGPHGAAQPGGWGGVWLLMLT